MEHDEEVERASAKWVKVEGENSANSDMEATFLDIYVVADAYRPCWTLPLSISSALPPYRQQLLIMRMEKHFYYCQQPISSQVE